MMKMRNVMTGMALSGALLASASVAKANAYMELISGSTTVQVEPGGAIVASGPYTDNFSAQMGHGVIFVGAIGSWSVNIASGAQSGSLANPQHSLNITLTDNINGSSTQTHGLELIYSSDSYDLGTMSNPGHYDFGASDGGGNSLTATVSGYYNYGALFTGGSLPTYESHSHLMGSWTLPKTFAQSDQNLNMPIYGDDSITEVMLFGANTASITPQKVTMNVAASFTPYVPPGVVPDGGMTASMVGAALLGLVGLRSKFGAKRA
jgi:hypothetical protein